MSDLVKRLREGCPLLDRKLMIDEAATDSLMSQGAARIEALEAALRNIDLWTDKPVSHASYIKAEIRAALKQD